MKEFSFTFEEGIVKGLIPTERRSFNEQGFSQLQGVFSNGKVIQEIEIPEMMDVDELDVEFPFPQIFKLNSITLVFTSNEIFEYSESDGSLTSLISTSEGGLWSVADYNLFIVATNGKDIIIRDGLTGEWNPYIECEIPTGICVCNLNGQLIIGGPETQVSAGFRE